MSNIEKKISDYIDALNEGKKPAEHDMDMESFNYEELMETVRRIGSIKDVEYPDENFERRLVKKIKKSTNHVRSDNPKKKLILVYTLAVTFVILIGIIATFVLMNTNHVRVMAESYQEIKAYHGILETFVINELGEETLVQSWDVRKDAGGEYIINIIDGYQKGITTINNGEQKWQINREENEIILYEVFPDHYPFSLDLASEIENAENAIKVKKIGKESILDKFTIKLEVTPKGGDVYYLWIDKESKMPVQRESTMINSLQYRTRYNELIFEDAIPDELIQYEIPEGFTVINRRKEQIVNNMEDATNTAGFVPKTLKNIPAKYELDVMTFEKENRILKTYYNRRNDKKNVILMQELVSKEVKPDNTAIIGKVNNNNGEYQPRLDNESYGICGNPYSLLSHYSSIRWQEQGVVYAIIGNVSFDELSDFAAELSGGKVEFDLNNEGEVNKPQVNVEVNMKIEINNQKSVDLGNSPWLQDPAYLAQVWASLKISPQGIEGEKTKVRKVYLERLVRQDSTGIWTVTGYDPK